jgi:hypothetical protein
VLSGARLDTRDAANRRCRERGIGSRDRASRREVIELHSSLAALFVTLALAGCAQGTTGQAGAQYAPYSQDNGIRPEHGGGDGGGGGGGM